MDDLTPVSRKIPGLSLSQFITSSSILTRKNELSRIKLFEEWLDVNNLSLFDANLRDYRDYLLSNARQLQPASVNAHLNSIRGRYRRMMKSDIYRNTLSELALLTAREQDIPIASISDQLAIVNEMERRLENKIFADDVFAREIYIQDEADEDGGTRLTESQAVQLMRTPDIHTLRGLRDATLLALMICTGVREHEAVAVAVDDVRCHYEGFLALRVKEGKGAKQRMIPYGNLIWCLEYIDTWQNRARIHSGPLLRGFWGDSDSIRPEGMSVRQINRILERYPINISGKRQTIRPHDLRRTYAKLQFTSGMKPEALQQNMGHSSYDTTLRYIGDVDANERMSQSTLPMPHTMTELQR